MVINYHITTPVVVGLYGKITTIMKIIVILFTSNYILYLTIELIVYIIQNVVNGYIVNRRYSYIYSSCSSWFSYQLQSMIYYNKWLSVRSINIYFIWKICPHIEPTCYTQSIQSCFAQVYQLTQWTYKFRGLFW